LKDPMNDPNFLKKDPLNDTTSTFGGGNSARHPDGQSKNNFTHFD